jgi:hypothetical protein
MHVTQTSVAAVKEMCERERVYSFFFIIQNGNGLDMNDIRTGKFPSIDPSISPATVPSPFPHHGNNETDIDREMRKNRHRQSLCPIDRRRSTIMTWSTVHFHLWRNPTTDNIITLQQLSQFII